MSGNPADDRATTENPPAPAPQPPGTPVFAVPSPPLGQQVACQRCYTLVPTGTRYCPQCGSPIPPPMAWSGTYAPPPTPPRRNMVAIVVAVVLVAVLLVGVAGYLIYTQEQQQVLQAGKNNEANAASNAINQLTLTCFSNRTDSSQLHGTPGAFSGYITVSETFGISNPTIFTMDVTWTITYDYPSVGWVLSSTQTFHEAPSGVAYPTFAFTVTGAQLNNVPANANLTTYSATIKGIYTVVGTFGTYSLSNQQSYNSTTSGSGSGSSNTLPSC